MAIPPRRRPPRAKSVTCVARSATICGRRSIRRKSSGVMRVCGRCSTTAPARRRRRRATMCLCWRLLPYCRCSAARSPRTDDWPRRQWRSWLGSIPACVAHGRRTPRCRAAIFRGMAVNRCVPTWRGAIRFSPTRNNAASSARTEHSLRMCSETHAGRPTWGAASAQTSPSARSTGWSARNGPGPQKTCSGAAASLDCASVSPRHEL